MEFTFPTPETDIVDTYRVSLNVPAIEAQRHNAYEVTLVRVSLTVVTEDNPEEDVVKGDILASVDLSGYQLAKTGQRYMNHPYGTVFGVRDEETRFEIARQALLASCERHHLDPTKVVDHSIATWAEQQAAQQARLLKQFGITQESH